MKQGLYAKVKKIEKLRLIQKEIMIPTAVTVCLLVIEAVMRGFDALFYGTAALALLMIVGGMGCSIAADGVKGEGVRQWPMGGDTDVIGCMRGRSVGGHTWVSFVEWKARKFLITIRERKDFGSDMAKRERTRFDEVREEIFEKWNVAEKLPKEAVFGISRVELLILPDRCEGDADFVMLRCGKNRWRHDFCIRAVLIKNGGIMLLPDAEGGMTLSAARDYRAVLELLGDAGAGINQSEKHMA